MKKRVFALTERDSRLLVTLYKHRFLSISQIRRLFFPSLQTAYRRMRLLRESGYVTPFTVPNIAESMFGLTRKGITSVAASLGVETEELQWKNTKTKPKDYYFMRHFLAINDFRILLKEACDESDVNLLGFIPEYLGEKSKRGGMRKYIRDVICDIESEREEISHTPDGVFSLEKNGKPALFFLEIDRGTEVVSNTEKGVLKTIRFYMNYLLEGKYARYARDFGVEAFKGFRVLFVTTSENRVSNIREATSKLKLPEKAKQFVWLTTFEMIMARGPFDTIWQSALSRDLEKYSIRSR